MSMMTRDAMRRLLPAAALAALVVTPGRAQEGAPDPVRVLEQSQQAFYSPGADMKARVTMDLVTDTGKKRTRVLTLLRINVPASKEQRYFLYFHEPGDVRRTAFLVFKYPEKDDDRWIFIPAVNAVRRVAARDSQSSFVGSDFTYEDISGRDLSADAHTYIREEKLGDASCHVIQSVPKAAADYTRKLSWIDSKTNLPLKEEYYDQQNELSRVFTADRVEDVASQQGAVATITRRTMKNVKSGHRTEVSFDNVAYGVGIEPDLFREQSLESPPDKWIK